MIKHYTQHEIDQINSNEKCTDSGLTKEGWYFWDEWNETESRAHGPFTTKEIVKIHEKEYAKKLEAEYAEGNHSY